MKRCFCYLLTLVLGSLAVGGLVFALLRTDVLTLTAATPTALFFFAATAAAGLDRHDHLTGDLGKDLGPLGVRRALGLLDIVPLGMSGHISRSLL